MRRDFRWAIWGGLVGVLLCYLLVKVFQPHDAVPPAIAQTSNLSLPSTSAGPMLAATNFMQSGWETGAQVMTAPGMLMPHPSIHISLPPRVVELWPGEFPDTQRPGYRLDLIDDISPQKEVPLDLLKDK